MTGVYKITNTVTSNFYIGSSSHNLNTRRRKHFDDLRKGKHHNKPLQRAFDKYGEASLSFDVLCITKPEQSVDVEQIYIDWLKPEYNTCKNARSVKGIKRSKEFCEGISKRMMGNTIFLGKTVSEETKQKISIANKGRMPYTFGKKRPQEIVDKIAKILKGKKRTEEQRKTIKEAHQKRFANGATSWNKGLKMSDKHKDNNRKAKEIYSYVIEHVESKETFISTNLHRFCKERGFTSSNFKKTYSEDGNPLYKQHKGYRILKITNNK